MIEHHLGRAAEHSEAMTQPQRDLWKSSKSATCTTCGEETIVFGLATEDLSMYLTDPWVCLNCKEKGAS